MTEFPIRMNGAQFDEWATSKNRRTGLRRSTSSEKRGFERSGRYRPFAFADEAEAATRRSGEDAVVRSQETERDNDVGFVLNTLWNVDKHRRLPALRLDVISQLWWIGVSDAGLTTARLNEPLIDGQVLARDEASRRSRQPRRSPFSSILNFRIRPLKGVVTWSARFATSINHLPVGLSLECSMSLTDMSLRS